MISRSLRWAGCGCNIGHGLRASPALGQAPQMQAIRVSITLSSDSTISATAGV